MSWNGTRRKWYQNSRNWMIISLVILAVVVSIRQYFTTLFEEGLHMVEENQMRILEKFGQYDRPERILETVRYYRALGFFENDRTLTDEQLAQQIDRKLDEFLEPGFYPFEADETNYDFQFLDCYITQYDPKRVWYKDLEMDALNGNDQYAQSIREFAAISRGYFQPERVKETWLGEEGPIQIEYDLKGKKIVFEVDAMNDFLNVDRLLNVVNQALTQSGYQFEYFIDNQGAYVILVNAKEREQLIRDRFLPFL